jgi:formylglycine-generating enzyme required for sulfatase activity
LHAKIADHYPWGNEWPPPKGVGNYADESAVKKFGWENVAPGYDDGYVYTSPVGSFPPNRNKIFDMGGNVWEWVQEWFDDTETTRALRGASWTTNQPEMLLTSARDSDAPEARRGKNGFRLVLAVE